MEKQKGNGTSVRLRKKIMQGVLGCLFAVGVMLLLPGTEMKAQAAASPIIIKGIAYLLDNSDDTCKVAGYNADDAGTEVHIPAEIPYGSSNCPVTKIGAYAFFDKGLEKITLEEGLKGIRDHAFENTKLTEIEIPASVVEIYSDVFKGCRLTKIRFRGKTPPYMMAEAFFGISGTVIIEIPEDAEKTVWETELMNVGFAPNQYTIQIGTPSSGGDSSSDSSSIPAEQGGKEASLETAEEEPVNRIPEHACQYEWETVREAGAGQDGLEQYLCKLCGSVQSTLTIPAAQYQVQELYTKVTGAAEGETVTYDMGQIHTVCDKLFTKLQERNDITLILTYRYKGADRKTTFPAGADYAELMADEEQFYGMLGLNGRCGIVTE